MNRKRAEDLLHQLVADVLEVMKDGEGFADDVWYDSLESALRKVGAPYYTEDEVTNS